jgi:hypothetical protein
MKSLPGWAIKIDEISNGVFKVTLKDAFGHIAEVIDTATDSTIEKAKSDAFDVERQISKQWSLFLYDFCLLRLEEKNISESNYHNQIFGSWLIRHSDTRIIYDGRDALLIYQSNESGDWEDNVMIKSSEVTYNNFIEIIDKLNNSI